MKYTVRSSFWFFSLVCAIIFTTVGCATRSVKRIGETDQVDLSGRWNDTDSRLVSEEMVRDSLSRPWLEDFTEEKNRKPAVVVGLVRNLSHEIIGTETFIRDIEREFLNSGKVRVVQAGEAREQLRAERRQQENTATIETVKRWGKELGADLILQGSLNSIVDSSGKQRVIFYQVDLELTDIETGEKKWIGTKKIKKLVKN